MAEGKDPGVSGGMMESNTGQLLRESTQILHGESNETNDLLHSVFEFMGKIDTRLTAIEKNTENYEKMCSKLVEVSKKVDDISTEVKDVKQDMKRLETDVQGMSNFYDQLKESSDKTVGEVKSLKVVMSIKTNT